MDSWQCLVNMLVSSRDPFRSSRMFMLHGLYLGVPLPSHFLKLARSSRASLLFHGKPVSSLLGYLYHGVFV